VKEIKKFAQNEKAKNMTFILTDDSSDDGSFEILTIQTKNEKMFRIIKNNLNRGYGANARNGINFALENGYQWAIVMDSDLSNPLSDLLVVNEIISYNTTAEYIKGNRFTKNLSGFIKVPLTRKILSITGNRVARLIMRNLILDPTNGFRAIKLTRWTEIQTYENGFPVIVEELQLAIKNELNTSEFETILRYDQILRLKSSFNFDVKTLVLYLKYLIKARGYIDKKDA
jgi:hypothetical protein